MRITKIITFSALLICALFSCVNSDDQLSAVNTDSMMIRLSEIEIYPEFLKAYLDILKEESKASVRLESGVISIYPMFQKENPNSIRILEVYASKEAYEIHLQTPHFKEYKTSTLHMVQSLKLIDMQAIDPETMPDIFKKISPD